MKSSKRKRTSRSRNVETEPFLSRLIKCSMKYFPMKHFRKHIQFMILLTTVFASHVLCAHLFGNQEVGRILTLMSDVSAITAAASILFPEIMEKIK